MKFLSLTALLLTCSTSLHAVDDVYNVFTDIYKRREWGGNGSGEGISGVGSIYENAVPYVQYLQQFIRDNKIRTVVDIGCGDWELSKYIDWKNTQYLGVDVVQSVIERDRKKYGSKDIQFYCIDGIHAKLPKAELLICKDVLQHLPNEFIHAFIKKMKGYKYCLITNDISAPGFSNSITNKEIEMGKGRFIDLSIAPFFVQGHPVLHYCSPGTNKQVFLVVNDKWKSEE